MSKCTQGPWKVERYVVNRDGEEVSSISRGSLTERLRVIAGDDSSGAPIIADIVAGTCADANLMALAPEMEEALRAIKDHEQNPNGDACVLQIAQAILGKVDRARAAIEKADGKS